MGYEEFKTELKSMLKEKLGDGVEMEEQETYKINRGKVEMLSLKDNGKKDTVCRPALCLAEAYQCFQHGGSMEEIAASVMEQYSAGMRKLGELSAPPEELTDYEKAKDKIFFRVVNTEKNREMLAESPHIPFLDLSLVFYLLMLEEDEGIGSVRISRNLMEKWGISAGELERQAAENTPRLFPVKASRMDTMLKEIFSKAGLAYGEDETEEKFLGDLAYILTNRTGINGFGAVLYPQVLQGMADRLESDLAVIPSSIHEAIVVPHQKENYLGEIREAVREVNRTCVSPQEVLSDEVYLFEREKGILTVVKETDHDMM